MESDAPDLTALLQRIEEGDKEAENQLYEIVTPELRRFAHHLMSRERPNHTLQATELVNRMYLRLAGSKFSLRSRGHFFAIAARAMRRELIDYARTRPKVEILPVDALPESALAVASHLEVALVIDELLDQMREAMPVECAIVELKFSLGMTDQETAENLNIPLRTMQAKWHDARVWLFERAEMKQWKPSKAPSW